MTKFAQHVHATSLLLALLLLVGGRTASASDTIETIDVPVDLPVSGTFPEDINNFGAVVGRFGIGGGQSRCFLQVGKFLTGILFPNRPIDPTSTLAAPRCVAINDRGQIVGTFVDQDLTERSFLFSDGLFLPIDQPTGATLGAAGINRLGTIVGSLIQPNGMLRGFSLSKGELTIFSTPTGGGAGANAINDRGDIVGNALAAMGTTGFLLSRGRFTTIAVPGSATTQANDINNFGQVAGTFQNNLEGFRGFVLSRGRFVIVDVPEATDTFVTGINDFGEIVGTFTSSNGDNVGFRANFRAFRELGRH